MDIYQDDKLLLKFHIIQPEINTRTGPQMNPDWEAVGGVTAHVWTLSVKRAGRECFKIGAAPGAKPSPAGLFLVREIRSLQKHFSPVPFLTVHLSTLAL